MAYKFYLYKTKSGAQNLVDVFTQESAQGIPYTEIRQSNNSQGYAVRADEFTAQHTSKTPQDLPADFYIENI